MNFYETKHKERMENIGKRFGRLLVKSIVHEGGYWKAESICDCGKIHKTRLSCLTRDESKSCGCYAKQAASERNGTHRLSKHRLYHVWRDANRRCNDPKRKDYSLYGGRGILMCDRWSSENPEGLKNFIEDMEPSFEEGLELERVDREGSYEPNNCTWVGRREQTNNVSTNRSITYKGTTLTASEWGHLLGVKATILTDRVGYCGWDDEKALSTPVAPRMSEILYKNLTLSLDEFMKELDIKFHVYIKKRKNKPLTWMEEYGGKLMNPPVELGPDRVLDFFKTGLGYEGDSFAQNIRDKITKGGQYDIKTTLDRLGVEHE